ncbi:MAG: prepilin-type N-terminal cleavage/methylation domain-containing protein [Candidatus Omnitrophica bacterium]|nr:prepilin-type N-terminal cleavage/methylation domain-containing protein [Candidatus Omnitrophota bacterium]
MKKYFIENLKKLIASEKLADNKGVTLAEIMVTMLIFSIISVALFTMSIVGENSWQVTQAKTEVIQELRKSMDAMNYDLIETGSSAISNVLPDTDASPYEDTAEDDDWYSSITFQLPTGVSGGSLQWGSDNIQFMVNGENQLVRITPSGTRVVAQNITSLGFYRSSSNSDMIQIALTAQKTTTRGMKIQLEVNFSVKMRN